MIEMSKPKFNSYPSNSFNKGFTKLKQFKSFRPGSYEKKFGNTKTESTWHASQLNLKSEVSESSQVEKKASGDIRVPSAPNESREVVQVQEIIAVLVSHRHHLPLPHLGSHYFIMFLLIMLILLIPLRQIHLHFIMFIHSIILQLLLLPPPP